MVEADDYDEFVKLKNDNEKLKKDLEEIKSHNTIVLESLDHDGDLILENEKLKEENKKLKEEKNNDALKADNKKLLMNTVMKMDRSGIGYLANQEKKAQAQ